MKRSLVPLAAVLLAGCAGYSTRFERPEHLKTFAVEPFTNKTLERNVDMEFTQALIHEILAKTNLRRATEGKADLLVTGSIEDLGRHSVRRKAKGLKGEMRHVLVVNVQMEDRKEDRLFFDSTRVRRRAEFRLNRGDLRRDAREEVIRELARRVVSQAFERWPKPGEGARAAMEAEGRAR